MGPNESQLRAALHDGEGDGLDANRLISHAVGVRRERRRRITTAAGAAVVVAVVGVGVTTLVHSSDSSDSSGGASAASRLDRQAPADSGAYHAPAAGAAASSASSAGSASGGTGSVNTTSSGAVCPQQPEHVMLPGGGGIGQFGSSEKLFPTGASSIRVCGYPSAGGVRTVVVRGAAASALAARLEAAPTTASSQSPPPAPSNPASLELLATGTDGKAAQPVTITITTAIKATNGTAVRYLDTLPTVLADLVRVLPDRVRNLPSSPSS